ncbi:uncharacterized protein LOC129593418 [Paramacrobiotus metropolitanus]|uniref:uncharacterized protein LOC129593418 n=1 Tax=Paramacrobiotus metropolitanus TaxID=2943436 RepID=UPI002445DD1D|nr:uncharacterized protein LOC129593418 [Paramacrobiotus metropolitanus]XP_055345701.1 uncharacterized protein LOC129593418 [Paramacrobiotus metropolitanus]XP_055345711.1 uncharacterized protein LOC129593418 [Paramacrobiotus metropolitanus]
MKQETAAPSSLNVTRLWNRVPVLVFGIIQLVVGMALNLNDIIGFIYFRNSRYLDREYAAKLYSTVGSVFFVMGTFFVITGILGIKGGARLPADTPPSSRRALLIACAVMSILGAIGSVVLIILSVVDLGLCVQFGLHILMFQANVGQAVVAVINLCKMPKRAKTLKVAQIVFPSPGTYPGAQALICDPDGQPVYFLPTQSTGPTAPPQQQQGTDVGQPLIKQNNVYQKA